MLEPRMFRPSFMSFVRHSFAWKVIFVYSGQAYLVLQAILLNDMRVNRLLPALTEIKLRRNHKNEAKRASEFILQTPEKPTGVIRLRPNERSLLNA